MKTLKYKKGKTFIFYPDVKYSYLSLDEEPDSYAGKKVAIVGPAPKDENNWDYEIVIKQYSTSRRTRMCKEHELVPIRREAGYAKRNK